MDRETEIRRRINYVMDLIQKSDFTIKGESKDDYFEYYRNYQEVVAYLNRSSEKITGQIPRLIKPNIFNKRLGGLWTIAVLGLLNPFFAILIFAITFPVSLPYLVARGITLRRTKNRIEEAKIYLTGIVNKLKEQKIEMTSR
jgi:hypothetical protein